MDATQVILGNDLALQLNHCRKVNSDVRAAVRDGSFARVMLDGETLIVLLGRVRSFAEAISDPTIARELRAFAEVYDRTPLREMRNGIEHRVDWLRRKAHGQRQPSILATGLNLSVELTPDTESVSQMIAYDLRAEMAEIWTALEGFRIALWDR